MKRYIPNQNLITTKDGLQCSDGTVFPFAPWALSPEKRAAHAAANEHEYNLRQATEQRAGRKLSEREYQRAVKGQPIDPQPTGSVVSTNDPREEVNPYASLLAMKRGREQRMNPEYQADLLEKSAKWQAEHEAKQRRAELESTREYVLMNEHAKHAYRAVVNDPQSNQVGERAQLLKIAESGDYETYWKTVAEKKLDETLVTTRAEIPAEPTVRETKLYGVSLTELPIDLEPAE